MRSWIGAMVAFAAVVTTAKLRVMAPLTGSVQLSHTPPMASGAPSLRAMAKGLLHLAVAPPLVERLGRHQAATSAEGSPETRQPCHGLGAGVVEHARMGRIALEVRDQAPAQQVEAALAGLGVVAHHGRRPGWAAGSRWVPRSARRCGWRTPSRGRPGSRTGRSGHTCLPHGTRQPGRHAGWRDWTARSPGQDGPCAARPEAGSLSSCRIAPSQSRRRPPSRRRRSKVIHIDMDAFYASAEQRDDPTLRGRPAGRSRSAARASAAWWRPPATRARRFGVRSAMSGVAARRRCPDLVFVRPRFDVYKAVSAAGPRRPAALG